jgi:PKD repeat protein
MNKYTRLQLFLFALAFFTACNLKKIDDDNGIINNPCAMPPVVAFSLDKTSGTAPCEIAFTNTTTNANEYLWDFGDGTNSNLKDPAKKTYTQAGNYTIRLIASKGECKDTLEKTVMVVNPLIPVKACATITSQSNGGTVPSTISFSATCSQSATTFNWDFGDTGSPTNTGTGITTQHTYNTHGSYTVKLLATGASTNDDTTFVVQVKPPKPVASFTVGNNGCPAPCITTFTNTSTNAVAQIWDFGDTGTSTQVSPTHNYLAKGNFTVRLIVTSASGEKDTAENIITIIQLPTANFTITNNDCVGPCNVTFTENCQFETAYKWDFGDGITSTTASPVHPYSTKGSYNVRLIALNADGADTITKTVTIKSANFATVFNVNGSDVDPLLGVQRTDGQFHVLFKQNAYKSVLINPAQTVGNVATHTLTDLVDLSEAIPSGDGGFALVGDDNATATNAVVAKIGSTQTVVFSKKFDFNSAAQLSEGNGITLNSANQLAVTGNYIPTGGGDLTPGFVLVSQTGTLSSNGNVAVPIATTGSVSGLDLAQLSDGQYMIIGNQFTFGGTPKKYLVLCSATGSYVLNKDLGTTPTLKQIISVTTNSIVLQTISSEFALKKYNGSGNSTGSTITLTGITVNRIITASDGNIIAVGTKSNNAWMAKYNSSTMNATPIWEKEYAQITGTTTIKDVSITADGGYLATGLHTATSGVKWLYLVKTNATGDAN